MSSCSQAGLLRAVLDSWLQYSGRIHVGIPTNDVAT